MSTVPDALAAFPWPEAPLPQVQLIETDGIPLETPWHHAEIALLIDVVTCMFRPREDYYVGGNMFLYYNTEQARNRDYRGPDFFFVKGVNRYPIRRWWAVWDEAGRYPNTIIELLSPTTATEDRTVKKTLYETTFRTPDYFCYDPDSGFLQGWRLIQGRYADLSANERGWLWCEELQVWLGTWQGEYLGIPGTWLRLFDKDGRLLPTAQELEQQTTERERARAEEARARAEMARVRAQEARVRAEEAYTRAEEERARAEAERSRAEAAEKELSRLQAELAALQKKIAESQEPG